MGRIRRVVPRLQYSWKIFISFIIVVLIPVTIFAAFIYSSTVSSLKGQFVNTLNETSLQIKADIKHKISNYETIAFELSRNPVLVSYFDDTEMSDSKVDFVYRYINPFVEWVYGLDPTGFDIRFFTRNDKVFENAWIYKAAPFMDAEWYRRAIQTNYSKPYWESFHPSRRFEYDRNKPLRDSEISIFLPVYSQYNNKDFTLLEVFIQTDDFFVIVDDAVLLSQMDVLICDENQSVVYSKSGKDYSEIEKNIGNIYTDHSGNEFVDINNQSYLISVQQIEGPSLKIVGLYPLQAITGEMNRTRLSFVLYLVLSLCILTALSYAFSKSLMKNINKLVLAMKKVQHGHFDTEVTIGGNDEISELGQDFNVMTRKIDQLIKHVYKAEILQKDATLKALQNQIEPHFLYNVLETIKMLAEIKRERQISDALTELGALLRYTIKSGDNLVPLSAEIEHVKQYCSLQNLMMNERLALSLNIAGDILMYSILKLSLQPIVENAIIHGFKDMDGQCVVSITAWESDLHIYIAVTDNGKGITPERLSALREYICSESEGDFITSGNGVAIKNIYQRLTLKFESNGDVDISSVYNEGVTVTLKFPKIL